MARSTASIMVQHESSAEPAAVIPLCKRCAGSFSRWSARHQKKEDGATSSGRSGLQKAIGLSRRSAKSADADSPPQDRAERLRGEYWRRDLTFLLVVIGVVFGALFVLRMV